MEIKNTINTPHIPIQSFTSQTRLSGSGSEPISGNDDSIRSTDAQHLIDRLSQSDEVRQTKVDEAIRKLNSGEYLSDASADATADAILARG